MQGYEGQVAPQAGTPWARRLLRIALWLLLWAAIGLVMLASVALVAALGGRAEADIAPAQAPTGIDPGALIGAIMLAAPGLVLAGLPAPVLLLAAVIVRAMSGPRAEAPARRRFEHPLALAVAAAIGAASSVIALLVVVTGGTLGNQEILEAAISVPFLVMALPALLLAITAVVAAVLAVQRRPRADIPNLTEP